MIRSAALLFLLAPLGPLARAQETAPRLRLEEVKLGAAQVEAGGMLDLEAVLVNEGVEDWQEGAYSVSAAMFSAEGRSVKRTRPILIRGALAVGESRTLRIRKIRLPADLSGDYFCRVAVVSGGEEILVSDKLPLRVLGAESPAPEPEPAAVMTLSDVRLSAPEVEAGGKLDVSAVLVNEGVEDWKADAYSVSASLFSASGRKLKATRPIPIRRALALGESRTLRIRKMRIPKTISGDCVLQVSIREGDREVLAGEKLKLSVTEPKAPDETQALLAPEPGLETPLPAAAPAPPALTPAQSPRAQEAAAGEEEGASAEPKPEDLAAEPAASSKSGETPSPEAQAEPKASPSPPPPARETAAALDAHTRALGDFKEGMSPDAFSKARLSAQNRLIVSATREFAAAGGAKRKAWMQDALTLWRGALEEARSAEEEPWIQAQWNGGGSLWRSRSGRAELVEEWSDDKVPYTEAGRAGKLFGFFGGQLASGGEMDMMGVNARLGSTLLRNRYDAALILGYSSLDTEPKATTVSYGAVGRTLFPWKPGLGYNVGFQVLRISPSQGDGVTTVSALAGLNFFLGGGSFDVTLNAGNHSSYGLLAGYSFFFATR